MAVIRALDRLTDKAELAARLFLSECEKRGLNVLVTETLRTRERQLELYAMGRTSPGKIVTWTKNSRHMSGNAWDICKNKKGEEYSDIAFFKECGSVARSLGITWGGDWSKPDMPHFEIDAGWEADNVEEIRKIKEELSGLKEELAGLKSVLTTSGETVYHYTVDVPEYARPTIQKLLDKKLLLGKSDDDLDLTDDMVRLLVILDRSGIFA